MIHPWNACDDDGYFEDDELPGWEEIEEYAGPEFLMWRDKLDAETPTWRPKQSVYVHSKDWMDNLC